MSSNPKYFRDKFNKGFSSYVCEGDSISCNIGSLELRATIYRDDDATSPDERMDGFWPSLDQNDAGYIGPKSKRTLARQMAKAREVMRAWKNDEWFYCGVAVTVWHDDERLTGEFAHALWGVECNYPSKGANNYLVEVARELADEALADAKAKIARLSSINTEA